MNNQFVTDQILRHENIVLLFTGASVLIVLGLVYLRPRSGRAGTRAFTVGMLVSICTLLAYAASFVHHPEPHDVIFMIFASIAYIGIYVSMYLHFPYATAYLNAKRKRDLRLTLNIIVMVVCILCALLWFLSLFEDERILPEISTDKYDLLFWIGHAAEFVTSLAMLRYVTYHRRILSMREVSGLMALPLLILVASLLEPLSHGLALRYAALMLGELIACISLYGGGAQTKGSSSSFSADQRITLALGRIKPHYVGNILSSIYYLCEISPTRAQSIIGAFSDYMRSVLETVSHDGLVPFTYEMNIIRNYLTLEKLRFDENLYVDYDVDIVDFKVPALSVQPLVEKAVKQGIAPLNGPGTVHIETRHLAGNIVQIRIIDDGVGFDVSAIKDDPEYSDIRILQDRIKEYAGGNLTIESSPGHGATAIVALPLDR